MRFLGWVIASGLMLAIVCMAGAFVGLKYFSRDLPDYSQLENYEPPVTTRLYAADGRLMAEYATEKRSFVPIEAMPDLLVQAFISAEDQHFFAHNGVDPRGVARAAITNLRNIGTGRRPIGASTITQQVARNFLLTNELAMERKIREALLALRIERAYSKDKILELYLNQIYLGRGSYGVAAAALNYFDKSLPELTLPEMAYLAALPKAPNNYNPITRREAAVARRNYVIERMADDGAISESDALGALAADLVARPAGAADVIEADYFAEDVRRELAGLYGEAALYQGGLSVRTTLDARLQRLAERALRQGLLDYDRRHGWRGPIATFESFDNWAARLGEIAQPAGAGSWILALVLEAESGRAVLGFADGSQGVLPYEALTWAAPWLPDQRVGPRPERVSDVLTKGEVVLVSRLPNQEGLTPLPVIGAPEGEPPPGSAVIAYALEQIPDVQGAMIAIDPHTGRVKAMVGGYDYELSEFNRATQAARQPGSAFKPFVYLAALTQGYTPTTILLDSPFAVDQGPELEIWKPENYSGDFSGPVPMRQGIEKSRNLMTVRLLMDIGLEPVRDIARDFGVMRNMPLLYAMGLGAGEVTLLDLTAAYAMMVNGGKRIEPSLIDRIQDRTGAATFKHDRRDCVGCQLSAWTPHAAPDLLELREQVVDPVNAYQIVSMMQGVVERGTAQRLARLGLPLAGKTGTTNDTFDAWFVGFSPDLAVGVYVGFDTPRTLGKDETGSSAAAPIFGQFMEEALSNQVVPPFRIPEGVRLVRVNPNTGLLAQAGEGGIWEAFAPGTEPSRTASASARRPAIPGGARSTNSATSGGAVGGLY